MRSDLFLVHPDNQGALGVLAHHCHGTLNTVRRIGADPTELAKATAIELSNHEETRDRQLKFNRDLISKAEGVLAP